MMQWFYNILIKFAEVILWLPALFDQKIKLGQTGRKSTFKILEEHIQSDDRVVWMHCASLGEFEQGRPVLERIKIQFPKYKILLTFFSPSGYEHRKNYPHAHVVCYLPLDTRTNAKRFLRLVHPDISIFVKYEFWPNYLYELSKSRSKTLLISAVISNKSLWYRNMKNKFAALLNVFDHIFVQDKATQNLLEELGIQSNIHLAGDTRIDRTLSIANNVKPIPELREFCDTENVLVAGSTWPEDEKVISTLVNSEVFKGWKLICAPHHISEPHIKDIEKRFHNSLRYSRVHDLLPEHRVLIIDNIGMLNKIYQYGKLAYIGGGFGSGIHNTLEPAAFGLPVIFGPRYDKFVEATALIQSNGAFSISKDPELIAVFDKLSDINTHQRASDAVRSFMKRNRGATDKIIVILDKENSI
ncbi:MAG: 3-deoxy-D-manno-octulosonic acid transferase [Bacteroidia bacterium]|nr:3-deoxy-D-manno-octulosonic acid transferase [Bacteroidia bacterium]